MFNTIFQCGANEFSFKKKQLASRKSRCSWKIPLKLLFSRKFSSLGMSFTEKERSRSAFRRNMKTSVGKKGNRFSACSAIAQSFVSCCCVQTKAVLAKGVCGFRIFADNFLIRFLCDCWRDPCKLRHHETNKQQNFIVFGLTSGFWCLSSGFFRYLLARFGSSFSYAVGDTSFVACRRIRSCFPYLAWTIKSAR